MFGIDFSELIVIAIVALVVIGPERLPRVARTVGHLFGRTQRYVSKVKADISHEMQLDELQKLKTETQESLRAIENGISREIQAVGQAGAEAVQSADSMLQEATPGILRSAKQK
ncbi:Sec-independent protein translocase protein TatB [Propionivibrio limicola]|uniref:Sec-independent protein translocase protein TatB n=1 Tax=Propionivibrio limicola TaxID=167645 RepID=UPI001292A4E6|nr:Sec-independent protein translocase protein TatB [Propionivibrio limicola]